MQTQKKQMSARGDIHRAIKCSSTLASLLQLEHFFHTCLSAYLCQSFAVPRYPSQTTMRMIIAVTAAIATRSLTTKFKIARAAGSRDRADFQSMPCLGNSMIFVNYFGTRKETRQYGVAVVVVLSFEVDAGLLRRANLSYCKFVGNVVKGVK